MPYTIPQNEIAEIHVNGMVYRDWKTVKVEAEYGALPRTFEFTTSEDEPIAKNWGAMRIKTGDSCQIFLGGQLAVTGFVTLRRVGYDAVTHNILIAGRGKTQDAADSTSIASPGEYKNYNLQSIASSVLQPFGIIPVVIGGGDLNKKFKAVRFRPGETVAEFIERLARVRHASLTEDAAGNFVILGEANAAVVDQLIEGNNIKAAQCEIRDDNAFSQQIMIGQGPGNDQQFGRQTNWIKHQTTGLSNRFRPYVHMVERATDDDKDASIRNAHETQWTDSTFINADITVYGWFKSSGRLWEPGEKVFIDSPMLILHQDLFIQKVTFTQSDATGTETTLHLVRRLGDVPNIGTGQQGYPQ